MDGGIYDWYNSGMYSCQHCFVNVSAMQRQYISKREIEFSEHFCARGVCSQKQSTQECFCTHKSKGWDFYLTKYFSAILFSHCRIYVCMYIWKEDKFSTSKIFINLLAYHLIFANGRNDRSYTKFLETKISCDFISNLFGSLI